MWLLDIKSVKAKYLQLRCACVDPWGSFSVTYAIAGFREQHKYTQSWITHRCE